MTSSNTTATSLNSTIQLPFTSKYPSEAEQEAAYGMYCSETCTTKKKKCLVLDLDETLITSRPQPTTLEKIKVTFNSKTGEPNEKEVVKRPGLDQFLRLMLNYYDLYIYTSSRKEYALAILEKAGILPYFVKVFHRKHCQSTDTGYIKDLKSILSFPPSQIALIDDSTNQTEHNKCQSICIKAFNGCPGDRELEKLTPFLIEISNSQEIRPLQRKYKSYLKQQIFASRISQPQQNEPNKVFTFCEISQGQEDDLEADEIAVPKLDTTKFEAFQFLKTSLIKSPQLTSRQPQSTLAKTAAKFSAAKAAKWLQKNTQLTQREDCNIDFEDKEANLEKLIVPKLSQVKVCLSSLE